MKDVKRFLVYYNENEGIIGYRPHKFDWAEGDEIMTNGHKTVVFGIFEGTEKNMELAHLMMATLRKYQPRQKWVQVLDEDYDYQKTGDWFEDTMNFLTHSHYKLVDVKKKVWKNFDSQLDFVDDMLNRMEQ